MKVLPHGIFQGDAEAAFSPGRMTSLGIKGVLCVADDVVMASSEIPSLFLPIGDKAKVSADLFEVAVGFYDKFNPIFVFCKAGMNRSRVFAAALLMARGVPYKEAIELAEPPAVSFPSISLRQWAIQAGALR